jgi:chemotaxis protein histidine kinase CheA
VTDFDDASRSPGNRPIRACERHHEQASPGRGRFRSGPTSSGHLVLSATRESDELVIRISDDGAGIDWNALGRKAEKHRLAFDSDEQRAAALFQDGLSSRDQVTDVSGRGIGLAAVRQEVSRLGGTISVISQAGQGTTVEMRFPVAAMVGSRTAVADWSTGPIRRVDPVESLPT